MLFGHFEWHFDIFEYFMLKSQLQPSPIKRIDEVFLVIYELVFANVSSLLFSYMILRIFTRKKNDAKDKERKN